MSPFQIGLDRGPQYELIEPQDGPRIHADWPAERGEGSHDVAYVVPSLELLTTGMEVAGHPVVARIHSFGAGGAGTAAYFDTVDPLGFFVETVEPPQRMPPIGFSF